MSPPNRRGRSVPRPLVRVIHLTLGLDVGGLEKLLVEFARRTDRRRFALHFVSLTTRGPLAADIEACGHPVTALEVPDGLRPGLVLRLASVFRQLRPHTVHTHDDRPLIYGALASRLAGARRVIHTRHHQGSRLSSRQEWLVRLASMCNDEFVCISQDSAHWAQRQGVPRSQIRVIHNGIDLERFPCSGPNLSGPAVCVARLTPEKAIGTLLDAVALLTQERPDFRLLIAGDGPERAELERQAKTLGLGEAVRFLGTVHDVPALLAGARFFVLPSLTEGISLTLLEAMATGLPVLTTAVGGNPEVVVAGETGFLVPAQDAEALARGLLDLWTQPELCRRIGMAGRRRVQENFDVRHMVRCYEQLYG